MQKDKEETTTEEIAGFIAKLLLIFDPLLDEGDTAHILQQYLFEHGICNEHLHNLVKEIDYAKDVPLTHEIH